MLRITVSLVTPHTERELGRLEIVRVKTGHGLADYHYNLQGDDLRAPIGGKLSKYPRASATVWDLVIRVLARAIYGSERLRKRPQPVIERVPIREDKSGLRYIRFVDIPEPTRTLFENNMKYSTVPVLEGEGDCAYEWDWTDFVGGRR